MGMEKCKRHPEMWGWPGTPCNKCIAEMGEDCVAVIKLDDFHQPVIYEQIIPRV